MTLIADRRVSSPPRLATSATVVSRTPVRAALTAVLVRDDVYRVLDEQRTLGYIQIAGPVFVTLVGSVYNTSCEVAQSLDLESALAHLERHRD